MMIIDEAAARSSIDDGVLKRDVSMSEGIVRPSPVV